MASKLATFREDSDIWDRFQAKAKSKGTNASALLQRFVRDYLDDKLDSPAAAPDVDIQAMIDETLSSKIKELREEFEEHEQIYQSQCQKGFELQISTFRDEMHEAIATVRSEATAPANFTPALLQKAKAVAPLMLQKAA